MTSHNLSLVPAAASRSPVAPTVFSDALPVIANEPVNAQYLRLTLQAPAHMLDACRPGQFFQLLCPQTGNDRPFLRRPMSIYGIHPSRGELHFLYKVTGAGTRGLFHLGPGDTLGVVGPLGLGFEIRPEWSRLLLAARGVGLATLAPLALEARRLGKHLTAICSARRPDLLMSVDHFRDLGAEVITITDSEGTSGVDTLARLVEERIDGDGVDALFTCGSNRMLTTLRALSVRHGIPGQVALEQQMACGLGMCHCCVRPFVRDGETVQLRVCREGPVFDMAETVAW
jgi:dihydroorotate dehydrogenase electron transfer subunit